MTEAEWLKCQEPTRLLRTGSSERKASLVAAACLRPEVCGWIHSALRRTVRVFEGVADGKLGPGLLNLTQRSIPWTASVFPEDTPLRVAEIARTLSPHISMSHLGRLCDEVIDSVAIFIARSCAIDREVSGIEPGVVADARNGYQTVMARQIDPRHKNSFSYNECRQEAWHEANARAKDRLRIMLAHYVRDIYGNPFRPVTVEPHWLTSTVVGIAEAVYHERAFDRLPVLGDALEDAGCADEQVLSHCRGPGPHVRGCWVVDLLLGKE